MECGNVQRLGVLGALHIGPDRSFVSWGLAFQPNYTFEAAVAEGDER